MMRIILSISLVLLLASQASAKPQRGHENHDDHHVSVDYVPRIWSPNDVDDAIKLTQSKDLEDKDGAHCWTMWRPAALVMESHPLPKSPVKASDLQVARLVKITVGKLQADTACKWLSDRIQDAWGPFETAVTPRPTRRSVSSVLLGSP